jgi:Tfp pilus assembly protein PilO
VKRFAPILFFCRYVLLHPPLRMAAWAAAFFLALDLVVLVGFWGPAAFRHHWLEKSIGEYRRTEREMRQAGEYAGRYEQLVKKTDRLEAKWKNSATQADLIESLTRLSSKNKLKVVSQDFDVAPAKGGGQSLKQNLALVGNYTSIRHFLDDVESLPTLTVVEQARLERAGETGSKVRAILQLCTYIKPIGKGA